MIKQTVELRTTFQSWFLMIQDQGIHSFFALILQAFLAVKNIKFVIYGKEHIYSHKKEEAAKKDLHVAPLFGFYDKKIKNKQIFFLNSEINRIFHWIHAIWFEILICTVFYIPVSFSVDFLCYLRKHFLFVQNIFYAVSAVF